MNATFLIATRNAHKVSEIRAILGDQYRYLTLEDFPNAPKVIENAATFAGNATKKAVELAKWLTETRNSKLETQNFFVLADDSGLEVDALKGAPGVYSARFAALDSGNEGNSKDSDNNAKLLRLLKDFPAEKRTARFRCVIALTPVEHEHGTRNTQPLPRLFVMSMSSNCKLKSSRALAKAGLSYAPRGKGGFGYDPLFIPNGFEQSFAELGEDVKNKLSHRSKALEKLKAKLKR